MGTEIGTLIAKFLADTSHFDRGIVGVERGINKTTGALGKLGLQSNVLGGILGSLGSRVQGLSTLTSELGGSMGLLGTGMGVVSAVGIGLGVTMFKLAKSAAEAGDEIFDLTQKVNFSAESLSTLKNEGELAGVEFGAISASLGIFNKNVEASQSGNKELANTFKTLKIDVSSNEVALRSAFKALAGVEDEGQQAALAMKIFGRSGKEILGIVKSMNGDIDGATEKFRKMGTLITTKSAQAANEFSDKLKILEQRFDGVTRSIGERFMPTATDALDKVSQALDDNSRHAATWADALVSAAQFAATQIKHILEGLAIVIEGFQKTFGEGSLYGDIGKRVGEAQSMVAFKYGGRGSIPAMPPTRGSDTGEYAIAGGAGEYSIGAGAGLSAGRKISRISFSSGGGGKGGGGGEDPAKTAERIASLQLEAVVRGLSAEQEANKRALDLRRRDFNDYATQYMAIENRRHDAVVAGLDREQKAAEKLKKGREVALQEISNKRVEENTTHEENRNKVLDERGKILDQINDFIAQQGRAIADALGQTDEWDRTYRDFVETLRLEGVVLESNTEKRIKAILQIEREIAKTKELTRERIHGDRPRTFHNTTLTGKDVTDLGKGSFWMEGGTGAERPRIATVDEQVTRERLAKIRDQMHQLAGDLTDVFSQSISDGFNNGIKSGLQTLAQGLLRIVEEVFLRKMAQGLGDMLSGIAGGQGGGGGGFFGSLLRGIIGGVTGGLGGSIGGLGSASASAGGMGTVFAGAIGRDTGGPIWPNQLYKVHKDEYIMPTAPGFVIPKGAGGQQTIINKHYTIQLPPDSRGSYNSPKSRRQLSETLIAALEASKA